MPKEKKLTKSQIKEQFVLALLDSFREAGAIAARVRDASTIAVDLSQDESQGESQDESQDALFLVRVSAPRGKTSRSFDWDAEIAAYEEDSQEKIEKEAEKVSHLIEEAQNHKDEMMYGED